MEYAQLSSSRRSFIAALIVGVSIGSGVLCSGIPAFAQKEYPSAPIRIVLPFGAGGVSDAQMRLTADALSTKVGQPVVVENRPGAGGVVAARAVSGAPADGYTLGLISTGTSISVAIFKSLPFDPATDFEMISLAGTFDQLMVVNATSPYKTLGDFIRAAKASPGKLNVGTVNVGSTQNLGAELFKSVAGINFQIVTYRTSPESIVALLRNDVQLVIAFLPAVEALLAEGKVRAVAISGAERVPYLPQVPTVKEAGVRGYELTAWNGVVAPRGTPASIIATLNGHMKSILADPDLRKRYLALGIVPASSSPEELKERLVSDIATYRKIIEAANIPKR